MKFNSIRHRLRSLPSFNRSKISKANRNPVKEFTPVPDLPSIEPCLRHQANVAGWKPFSSFLIDTVKVKIRVKHPPLSELAQGNPYVKQDGFKFLIRCPRTDAVARLFSMENGTVLLIEYSMPKFLTGQNVIGHMNVHDGCLEGINKALNLLGLMPTKKERIDIICGDYLLTRVDITAHVDCQTPDRAQALLLALRTFIVRYASDVSMYGYKGLYIGQSSKRRTLKIYPKGIELKEKGQIPEHVYNCKYLTRKADSLVRFELTLRGKELTRLGLSSPMTWNKQVAMEQIQPWLEKLRGAGGVVPNLAAIKNLSPVMQNKLLLWLGGHVDAFTRGVKRDSYLEARKKVKVVTGIDVEQSPDVGLQAAAVVTISQLFSEGLGFRTHKKKWPKLLAAVQAYQRAQAVTTSRPKSCTAHK